MMELTLKKNATIKFITLIFTFYAISRFVYSSNSADSTLWKIYKFSAYHFSFESPFKFKSAVSPEKGWLVVTVYSKDEKLRILSTTCLDFFHGQKKLENMPDFLFEVVQASKTPCSDIKLIKKSAICSGEPSMLTVGSFKNFKGVIKKTKMLDIRKGLAWWEIAIDYDPDNQEQERMANRVIDSVKITN